MMRTSGGRWKSCALHVAVVVAVFGYFGWRLFRGLRPPPTQITEIGELSRLTGLTLPPQTVLLEGVRWQNYFLVARLRFPRADLARFLAEGAVKAGPKTDERDPLGKCLSPDPGGAYDVFHDGCQIEDGEGQILDSWRLRSIRHSRFGDCGMYPSPYPPPPARSGGLSLALDLDDPRTVLLFVKWDARGGFAC